MQDGESVIGQYGYLAEEISDSVGFYEAEGRDSSQ